MLPAAARMSVSLTPSVQSPAPLGTRVTWTATVSGAGPDIIWYRYRSRNTGGDFHVIEDYGPVPTLDWTAATHEGVFEVEVSARDRVTGEIAGAIVPFEMLSLVDGDQPVITPTSHPLVFLYS